MASPLRNARVPRANAPSKATANQAIRVASVVIEYSPVAGGKPGDGFCCFVCPYQDGDTLAVLRPQENAQYYGRRLRRTT
ncbi:hypothetical protein D3C81_1757980 [compost metagenome]